MKATIDTLRTSLSKICWILITNAYSLIEDNRTFAAIEKKIYFSRGLCEFSKFKSDDGYFENVFKRNLLNSTKKKKKTLTGFDLGKPNLRNYRKQFISSPTKYFLKNVYDRKKIRALRSGKFVFFYFSQKQKANDHYPFQIYSQFFFKV